MPETTPLELVHAALTEGRVTADAADDRALQELALAVHHEVSPEPDAGFAREMDEWVAAEFSGSAEPRPVVRPGNAPQPSRAPSHAAPGRLARLRGLARSLRSPVGVAGAAGALAAIAIVAVLASDSTTTGDHPSVAS